MLTNLRVSSNGSELLKDIAQNLRMETKTEVGNLSMDVLPRDITIADGCNKPWTSTKNDTTLEIRILVVRTYDTEQNSILYPVAIPAGCEFVHIKLVRQLAPLPSGFMIREKKSPIPQIFESHDSKVYNVQFAVNANAEQLPRIGNFRIPSGCDQLHVELLAPKVMSL